MAPKHNELARREVDMMLRASEISAPVLARSFLNVTPTKKDGKPRFCVKNWVLSRQMKAGGFPLSEIQEMFVELSERRHFSRTEFFSAY